MTRWKECLDPKWQTEWCPRRPLLEKCDSRYSLAQVVALELSCLLRSSIPTTTTATTTSPLSTPSLPHHITAQHSAASRHQPSAAYFLSRRRSFTSEESYDPRAQLRDGDISISVRSMSSHTHKLQMPDISLPPQEGEIVSFRFFLVPPPRSARHLVVILWATRDTDG